jgi:hypothetical protein
MSTGMVGSGGTDGASGTGGLGNAALPVMHLMTQPIKATTMAAGVFLYARLTRFNFVFDFIFVFLSVLLLFFSESRSSGGSQSGFALIPVHAFYKTIYHANIRFNNSDKLS